MVRRRRNEIIFVSGQRGSGKTFWTRRFCEEHVRIMIFDPMSEYRSAATHSYSELEPFLEYMRRASKRSVVDVSFDPLDTLECFRFFCRCALALGNVYVVIEEVDLFCRPSIMPKELEALIKYGRHKGVNLVAIARRPAEVGRLLTSQATRYVIFNQIEPKDIAYWRSILGDLAHDIPALARYHFLDVDFSRKDPIGSAKSTALRFLVGRD